MQNSIVKETRISKSSNAKMKIKEFAGRHKRILSVTAVFLVSFLLLMSFWNQPWFSSDEAEIFMHGQSIARGEMLYQDIGSQHMPVMYYISAFFSLIGIHTITGFRICFYLLTALLWALMYDRYKRRWGSLTMILYPLLYICTISQLEWTATCILSDQYQAIGMVILFFEFMEFNETRILKLPSCCMISLAVFLSFGSAFVSAFAICIIVCAVVALDIWDRIKGKMKLGAAIGGFFKQFWKVVVIVALPFVLLFLFYLLTGTLDDFINWAYLLNRTVYVNYTAGYGSSLLAGFFGGYLHYAAIFSFTALNAAQLLGLFLVFCSVGWIIHVAKRGNGSAIRVIGLVLFLIACATRGLLDFHGTPALAVLCAMSACFLQRFLTIESIKKNIFRLTIFILSLLFIIMPYLKIAGPAWVKIGSIQDMKENSTAWCLDIITEDGERVGFGVLNCDIMVMANVRPASVQGGSVPWFWDYAGDQTMEDLKNDPPRAYLCSIDHVVWGHKITDYAPELIVFLQENYTPLDAVGQPTLWVRNDYAAEATARILEAQASISQN